MVEPASTADRDRLRAALDRLAFEDPSFHVREDEETGQWLIAGMGELHLEIKEHRLAQDFLIEVRIGQPRVAYREVGRLVLAVGGEDVDALARNPPPFQQLDHVLKVVQVALIVDGGTRAAVDQQGVGRGFADRLSSAP